MTTVTIPKKLARAGDLVVVPRASYEKLLRIAAQAAGTEAELKQALRDVRSGRVSKPFSLVAELKRSLGK